MKKSFKIGEKGKSAKTEYQGSPLDLILGEEDEKQSNEDKKQQPEAQKQAIEKARPENKPRTTKQKKDSSLKKKENKTKEQASTLVDKRRVEDKKKPFSTVLRGSLQKELKERLKQYRQEVDFEYNKAQFMEDAVIRQLNYIKRQLK